MFVALEIPDRVRGSLAEFQTSLSETGADIKLVERQNLHFTVRFLGEVSETMAAEAGSRLGGLSLKGGEVEVRGAGAFPSASRPRVVWAGVKREHELLVAPIAQAVAESMEGIGEREDKPFRAHITLARVRSGLNARRLTDVLQRNSDRVFGTARLAALKLKSSVMTPAGPVYSDLGVYPLA